MSEGAGAGVLEQTGAEQIVLELGRLPVAGKVVDAARKPGSGMMADAGRHGQGLVQGHVDD